MENKDRQFITERLAAGDKHDSIAHALLMRRALEEVEQVANWIAGAEHSAALIQQYIYYTVLGPQPELVLVRDEGGVELWQRQGRQQYKVLVKDYPQFCRDMKLNYKEMEAVATGSQYEYKGWISAGNSGFHYDQTRAAPPPPTPRALADAEADRDQAKRTPKVKQMSAYTPSPDPITYMPTR